MPAPAAPDAGGLPGACLDGCRVGGVCFPAGVTNPTNGCERCDPARATDAFSANDGAACDDGLFCSVGERCSGGACVGGTARDCDDGIACTDGARCEESERRCVAGRSTCEADALCDAAAGSCVRGCPGCLIDGVCFGEGQVASTDPCATCRTGVARDRWSPNDGAPCDDGDFCTLGEVCVAGACGGGTSRSCDDGVTCNGDERCDSEARACRAGTPTCGSEQVCVVATDRCELTCTGCVIEGECFGEGQRAPSNPCLVCRVAESRTAWGANDGAACDDGLFCTRNDACRSGACEGGTGPDFCDDGVACNGVEACDEDTDRCRAGRPTCAAGTSCNPTADTCSATCAGCLVDGVCHAPGTQDPGNPCLSCAPDVTASGWSARVGAPCEDGLFCTSGDTCSETGACVNGPVRDCSDGVACNGAERCDEAGDRCVPGASTCPPGRVCDAGTDTCGVTCAGCTIDGVCHADAAIDPGNPCRSCQASVSASAWTARVGASCDDGLYCTVGERCGSDARCEGGAARGCGDGIDCNGVETCNEASDRCEAGVTTCTGGRRCDPVEGCLLECVGGTEACGAACTRTATDPLNCGSCGVTCPAAANAVAACASGRCGLLCDAGTGDCAPAPGCETRLQDDAAHCGTCGNACPAGANATGACTNGRCGLTCATGFGDCTPAAGCETDVRTSTAHCGACGNACQAGQLCESGRCVGDCPTVPTFSMTCGFFSTVGDACVSCSIPVVAGCSYTLSTCPADGGFFSGDPMLFLTDAGGVTVGFNYDSCGTGPSLTYDATRSETMELCQRGFSSGAASGQTVVSRVRSGD